mmetsp:Transcript_93454/g.175799  ORF Transcript_93454/g.175799 Transcript_93454/m.175799 type:complete len:299 (-) Transcript_93454:89-985(-)
MSGLEAFLIVPAIGGAYAWWKGKKEKDKDKEELAADADEVRQLREALEEAHHRMSGQHKASADVWREPLSLFGKGDERRAKEAHVPEWAISCVRRMQTLVFESASQGDRADVYKTQLDLAEKEGKGLMRGPVIAHVQKLDKLTFDLRLENELLARARAAFDSPDTAPEKQPEASITKSNGGKLSFGYSPGRLSLDYEVIDAYPSSLRHVSAMESPLARIRCMDEEKMGILRERGRFGVGLEKSEEAGWKTIFNMGKVDWSSMNSFNGNASTDFYQLKKMQEEAVQRTAREQDQDGPGI